MKFAVTGGAGFVGSNIVHHLINKGHKVKVIDNLHSGKEDNLKDIKEKIEFEKIDIRDFGNLSRALSDVDGVFHEAALTVVQESFEKKEEYQEVNVKGTENVFKIAKKEGFKVVFASSSSIYGNASSMPIKEDFTKKPINPYGTTKLQDEILAEKYCLEGVKIIGLRYFNIYGIGQTLSYAGVITKFLDKLRKNKSPIIYGDGSQTRDFIYVKDVASANFAAMNSDTGCGFFNVGTGKEISILELCKKMIKIFNLDLEPIFKPTLQGDVKRSNANIELTKNKLQWIAKTQIDDGLEIFLDLKI